MDEKPKTKKEVEHKELESLVNNRLEKKKLGALATYGLGVFYTLFCGFVLGMLLNMATERGVWDSLFGENDVPSLPDARPSEGQISFESVDGDIEASLSTLTVHKAHNLALCNRHLATLGFPTEGHTLLDLRIANRSADAPIQLMNEQATIALTLVSGETLTSLVLPESVTNANTQALLKQRLCAGEVAADSGRRFWMVFPASFTIEDIAQASLNLPERASIELTNSKSKE